MKNTNWIWSVATLGALVTLSACGDSNAGEDSQEISFGATAGPYSDMLTKAIVPGLEEKGYSVTINEYQDYIIPNRELANGTDDANLFQHQVYLDAFAENNDLDLASLVTVPTAPMGIYSEAYQSLEDIEDGVEIAIPNDPTNGARAFLMLEDAGLITFKDEIDPLTVSIQDIDENKHNLQFVELEAAQLPREVGQKPLTAVPGNFALSAGLDLTTALELEDMADQYRNVVAVRSEDVDGQLAQDIQAVIESDEFEAVIDEEFEGFGKPNWMEQ
ncbi:MULTISPECIES: MetQ/NlpA family ABC transporter substrate-binding protein [Shouchella]|uniref:MetQ/NlpA family ABC transporter substrate-binding protein n=2 Tax=Shouchella TaxID=2893057 RepID=A0ABY7W901_9BACI|nr:MULTISPECIES: MetQ/NlpA family ABC transporter substrate-binding protein [Shouchella]MED4128996.1 MetQ/NlpA family ABC transporter substrate-binding protein [Shouchella miscanthi]WDF04546.1 MetQ/NlpA family ABC transporter substrate-binding protein [Shouchella hunanensis]